MKIKNGYLLREVAGNYIVVPVGEGTMNFSGVINLNEVGAFLWKALESDISEEELTDKLLGEYDIDKATAVNDIKEFVDKLRGEGILE